MRPETVRRPTSIRASLLGSGIVSRLECGSVSTTLPPSPSVRASCPCSFEPQHAASPLPRSAQVTSPSEESCVAPVRSLTALGPGTCSSSLNPSAPLAFAPQHWTVPPSRSAQKWFSPATRSVTHGCRAAWAQTTVWTAASYSGGPASASGGAAPASPDGGGFVMTSGPASVSTKGTARSSSAHAAIAARASAAMAAREARMSVELRVFMACPCEARCPGRLPRYR